MPITILENKSQLNRSMMKYKNPEHMSLVVTLQVHWAYTRALSFFPEKNLIRSTIADIYPRYWTQVTSYLDLDPD